MVDINSLNLSESLLSKLSDKKIKVISEIDSSAFKEIEEGSNVSADASVTLTPIILSIVKKIESKKLKSSRSPKAIVIVENAEECQKFIDELNSIITKEIVSVSCLSKTSMKKQKKMFATPVDVIVGESDRVNDLIVASLFKLKAIGSLFILNANNVINDESKKSLPSIIKALTEKSLDASANESAAETKLQVVLTSTEESEDVAKFVKKYAKNCVMIKKEEDSESESSEEEEKAKVVEVNGEEESSEEDTSSEDEKKEEESSDEEKKEEKMEVEEVKSNGIEEGIIAKVRSVVDFSEFDETAKKLIEADGDVKSLARALSLIAQGVSGSAAPVSKAAKIMTGDGSKLSGRAGYTAYLFKTNIEVFSRGYLFKALKRHIEEELVESIEKVQQTKDKMGFVFELASDKDDQFQSSWSDGKFDSMELLTGEVPELLPNEPRQSFDGGRGGRGGFERGGRGGGGRGGYERGGRGGGDRGGRGGYDRGGRGGDRGGKRPFNGSGPTTAAKVQKFE